MWTEIVLQDILDGDLSKLRLLKKFMDAQALMNETYTRIYQTKEQVQSLLEKKASLGIRIAWYDDGDTECTIALKKNGRGELRLLTTACSKGDVNTAADIVQDMLKKAMQKGGFSEAHALWTADNFDAGNTYFWAFVERASVNFTEAVNTEYELGKYKLVMTL